jgi:hypothetical protein
MSRTELHLGKMRKVDTQNKTNHEFSLDILKERGDKLEDFYEDATQQLIDNYYKEYFLVGKELYVIIEDQEFDDSDIAEGHVNPDGSISYVAMYYNGGAGLTEVLEEIVQNIKK